MARSLLSMAPKSSIGAFGAIVCSRSFCKRAVMTLKRSIQVALAALALGTAGIASAAVITLDFEGIADQAAVGNFYSAKGVEFSGDTLALVDADASGTGNFANEPSANTIMFFLDSNSAILNYAAGFTTGFSFYYSSSVRTFVEVFDGLDGGGTSLGKIDLSDQYTSNCVGDPTGAFCNWTNAGVSFAGTAKSIVFSGAANVTGFDNITFGSAVACTVDCNPAPIPEPATLALVGAALLGLSAGRRRKF